MNFDVLFLIYVTDFFLAYRVGFSCPAQIFRMAAINAQQDVQADEHTATDTVVGSEMQNIVTERVLAEWQDKETGELCTLGSMLSVNKQATNFEFQFGIDQSSHAFIRFPFIISIKAAGRPSRRDTLFVLPVHAFNFNDPVRFETLTASQVGTGPILAAIQEASLSASDKILRVEFNLNEPGYMLIAKTMNPAKVIKPSTSTSHDLLLGLQSLSKATRFAVYMKPSDYARQGLKIVCERLCAGALKQYPLDLSNMYTRGAELIDWSKFELDSTRACGKHQKDNDYAAPPDDFLPPYEPPQNSSSVSSNGSSSGSNKISAPATPPLVPRTPSVQFSPKPATTPDSQLSFLRSPQGVPALLEKSPSTSIILETPDNDNDWFSASVMRARLYNGVAATPTQADTESNQSGGSVYAGSVYADENGAYAAAHQSLAPSMPSTQECWGQSQSQSQHLEPGSPALEPTQHYQSQSQGLEPLSLAFELARQLQSQPEQFWPQSPPLEPTQEAQSQYQRDFDLEPPRKRRRLSSVYSGLTAASPLQQQPQLQHQHQPITSASPAPSPAHIADPLPQSTLLLISLAQYLSETLLTHHPTAYASPRLRPLLFALGQSARLGDVEVYESVRARCSAVWFYYGDEAGDGCGCMDVDDDDGVGDKEGGAAEQRFVDDLEALVRWANGVDRLADAMAREELEKLGRAAREVVGSGGAELCEKEYRCQKGMCVAVVLVTFGRVA
ncbi:uncharacterized protein K452DRAFT_72499 [Aplosporella prunicola CBS 121167]|uniref:Uncharacterized protein n=1 Tax=Aplosporella prunicola CBS 121167 TaxID=1176127 RepID=A0A6A6BS48_9PEZI|nr:uncharacterized protein K452DRAFT_72499 [Aplosporella prunicola CBS 121167]KAF2146906.1 hypothetical protein K452DRAFT_72499 [Aplosporella prunicola CBS 121167]